MDRKGHHSSFTNFFITDTGIAPDGGLSRRPGGGLDQGRHYLRTATGRRLRRMTYVQPTRLGTVRDDCARLYREHRWLHFGGLTPDASGNLWCMLPAAM